MFIRIITGFSHSLPVPEQTGLEMQDDSVITEKLGRFLFLIGKQSTALVNMTTQLSQSERRPQLSTQEPYTAPVSSNDSG